MSRNVFKDKPINKVLAEAIQFLLASGGGDYYSTLDLSSFSLRDFLVEMNTIAILYEGWMEEMTWCEEDIEYMKCFIAYYNGVAAYVEEC